MAGEVSSRNSTVTNKPKSLTYTVAFSSVSPDPFAVMTVGCRLDPRAVSNSAEFKSSLLNMCIHDKVSFHKFDCEKTWCCLAHIPCFTASPSLLLFRLLLETMLEFLVRKNFALNCPQRRTFFFQGFDGTFSDWCSPLSQVGPRGSSAFLLDRSDRVFEQRIYFLRHPDFFDVSSHGYVVLVQSFPNYLQSFVWLLALFWMQKKNISRQNCSLLWFCTLDTREDANSYPMDPCRSLRDTF